MKTLDLVLKRKWFDMIASGEKTEEYRDIKPYWVKRLIEPKDIRDGVIEFKDFDKVTFHIEFKDFEKVTFHLGYAKNRPSMTFAIKEIIIDEGKEEWGALPGETYFVIKLGERL